MRRCVAAIRQHTDTPYEIIVVDNASVDGTSNYCVREGLRSVRLPVNRGFPAACNLGLRLAEGDELLLLNNDVTVTPCWLVNLRSALHSAADIGIVGPVTNYVSGMQQVDCGAASMEQFMSYAVRNNVSDTARWREVRRLVGFCMLFSRELLDRIGYLDEGYGAGHYEDDDFCFRARLQGSRLLMCSDCFVHHEGSASFAKVRQPELEALIERNYRRFMSKWHTDPREFIGLPENTVRGEPYESGGGGI